MRHVEECMGTVFSFDIRDDDSSDIETGLRQAVASLHEVDRIFSTYKPDSDISRLGRFEISVDECDPLVSLVLNIAERAVADGAGAFTLHPGGLLDPSAVVKGWAIERASDILRAAGSRVHLVNGGGDIQSCSDGSFDWGVAIADPRDSSRVILAVGDPKAPRFAVATSGTAERGEHIVDPRGGYAGAGLLSVTVVGASLTDVDIAATTAFALGAEARDWVEAHDGFEAFGVLADGGMWTTTRFSHYVIG
jgi:thiamine biosynthesis lipoprotein